MSALEAGRPYLSIGEVLNVLKDEFPDVTVSKIRFLESEGLIQPERTSSGYRKFSEEDIVRLRFILRLQRDHFLPLKVIRERLEELGDASNGSGQSTLTFEEGTAAPLVEEERADEDMFRGLATGVSLSLEELSRASGLEAERLRELEGFGLLHPQPSDEDEARYNENDLEAAKLAKELLELGLEPRHLRLFRSTADRWAAMAEQMVLPLIKQRNPEARRMASEQVRDLVRIGNRLLQALLREAVSPYT